MLTRAAVLLHKLAPIFTRRKRLYTLALLLCCRALHERKNICILLHQERRLDVREVTMHHFTIPQFFDHILQVTQLVNWNVTET